MRFLFIFFSLAISLCAAAQSVPQYTNFIYNRFITNPAVAGQNDMLDITALYRGQWTGIEGAPSTQFLTAHAPIPGINSGVGLAITNDMMGAQRSTSITLSYAYRLPFRWGNLSFGGGFAMYQKSIDGTKLRSPEGDYTSGINHNDGFIPGQKVSGVAPEVQLGIYYYNDDLFAGLAVQNLLGSKISVSTPGGNADVRFARGFIFSGGYNIGLNRSLSLLPAVQLKTDLKYFQTDLSVVLSIKDNIHTGLSFRGYSGKTIDAASVLFGFRLFKSVRIGYSYDFSLSALNEVNSGSHEVFIKYQLKITDKSKPGKVIYNPRFL